MKIDGSPAIVWGTDPKDGKFFVGTKSVFNKKIPKLIKSIKDLRNTGTTVNCLTFCFTASGSYHVHRIYQGDFMGYGGDSEYTPNTLTYHFKDVITAVILVAPHTVHVGDWNHSLKKNPVPLKRGNLSLLYIVTSYNPDHISWNGLTIGKMKMTLPVQFG